ncbi:enoyl-CoA hydratase-related protein [Extibacter muris]|uniref:enoyl-CoA hydratase-related protein n=1 Tax=Extibacter muris TaxID=1796622 RepID=UPI001D08E820|nr:enoyl-CoA hydratase-related protein [Extibacter muris]MCB6201913.1 enoyl-CoA hydratase/isomerase family protein [Extibacter muris]MCQ4663250.1 enoyl-CoA hydratase-related protein [Extibacter muris]MCQ4692472.1 enoyl-CoA hydratase-related protein [Extibacter muris]
MDGRVNHLKNIALHVEDTVATVMLNRPDALNALDGTTLRELEQGFAYIRDDKEIYGVIITGSGRAFAAGADIGQMQEYRTWEGRAYAAYAQEVFSRIESLEKPVIAAVNGYALGGGCELALSCDIRIASEKAVFGQPEAALGVIPCFGGTQRLTRLIGQGKAKELIFTGRKAGASEALEIGLVNKVVPPERLIEEAGAMMRLITANAPIAVRLAKTAINYGMDMDLRSGLELEKNLAAITFGTEDKQEGMSAFLGKRDADFGGC